MKLDLGICSSHSFLQDGLLDIIKQSLLFPGLFPFFFYLLSLD